MDLPYAVCVNFRVHVGHFAQFPCIPTNKKILTRDFQGARLSMKLHEDPFCAVSQGLFSGWRVQDKMAGITVVPDSLMKQRVGLVWMQVRRTKKSRSVDSQFSEEMMFRSFARAVLEPWSSEGNIWRGNSPDEIADELIDLANRVMKDAAGPSHFRDAIGRSSNAPAFEPSQGARPKDPKEQTQARYNEPEVVIDAAGSPRVVVRHPDGTVSLKTLMGVVKRFSSKEEAERYLRGR